MSPLGRVLATPDRWGERETEQVLTINNNNIDNDNNGTLSEQESSVLEGGNEISGNEGGDVPEVLVVDDPEVLVIDDPAEAAEIMEEWTEATAEHDAEWFQQQEQQQQQGEGQGDDSTTTTTLSPTPVPVPVEVDVGDPIEGTFCPCAVCGKWWTISLDGSSSSQL